MLHTPLKETRRDQSPRMDSTSPKEPETTGSPSKSKTSQVRRSIGEWETKGPLMKQIISNQAQKGPKRASEAFDISPGNVKEQVKPTDRVTQARIWLRKAKTHLSESRNLKTDLKAGITMAVDEMFKLIKEEAGEKRNNAKRDGTFIKEKSKKGTMTEGQEINIDNREVTEMLLGERESDLTRSIKEHSLLIKEHKEAMNSLKDQIEKQNKSLEKTTYASVATSGPKRRNQEQAALHSVVVSSKDETDTGEEVLTRIREAVNAKEGWVRIDRVRKAKDRKVIVGCSSEEERQKVKERLKRAGDRLNVEEIKNKDPLLILRDVFQYNSDDDIKNALRKQNQGLFKNIDKDEDRIEIRFRRRTRNPHASHVIIRVSPKLWMRMVEAEAVHIDMQKIRVADYSPLVQCSLCLGYGHGKRFCKETVAKCSHCAGPHMKADCADWLANTPPSCCNCTRLKLDQAEHNAFSQECPVRRKWDALARASTAYC